MEQKSLHKILIIGILALSICSFTYVNTHSLLHRSTISVIAPDKNAHSADDCVEDEDKVSPLPARSISLVAKLVELAQKFTPGGR